MAVFVVDASVAPLSSAVDATQVCSSGVVYAGTEQRAAGLANHHTTATPRTPLWLASV